MTGPLHGFTRAGHPVHGRVSDHHPEGSRYQRFNKRVALAITANVGTMTCAWLFCLLAAASLPATLVAAGVLPLKVLPFAVLGSAGFILVVSWSAQSFIQLVLLPAIMVGQNLQSLAADARAAKTFEDVEIVLDRLDVKTEGGLSDLAALIEGIKAQLEKPRPSRSAPDAGAYRPLLAGARPPRADVGPSVDVVD